MNFLSTKDNSAVFTKNAFVDKQYVKKTRFCQPSALQVPTMDLNKLSKECQYYNYARGSNTVT